MSINFILNFLSIFSILRVVQKCGKGIDTLEYWFVVFSIFVLIFSLKFI